MDDATTLDAAAATLWGIATTTRHRAMVEAPRLAVLLGNLHGRLVHETDDRGRTLAAWAELPPDEAIKFFKSKRIVPAAEFRKLEDSAKRQAFSIAGVHTQRALHEAHETLTEAIAEGLDQRTAIGRLRATFDSAGMTSQSKHYLDTVFRTNVLGAYSEGHYAQAVKVRRARPFWRYMTVGDGRVRPAHQAMHGRVYAADDPIWDEWYPPNGFSCRCRVETLTSAEVEPAAVQTEPAQVDNAPAKVDRGFAGSPALQGVARRLEQRLQLEVARSSVLQPPVLATSGPAVFTSAGDFAATGNAHAALAGKLDRWSGIAAARARELASRPFEIIATNSRPPAGLVRFELAIPSQYADSLAQMARRIALDPRTDSVASQARVTHLTHYRAGAAAAGDATAVVADGMTRHGCAVLSIASKDPQTIGALAELFADAEAGSGAAIRRAPEKAHLVIRGLRGKDYEYAKAFRNSAKEGKKTRVVFSAKPLAKMKSEPVHLTRRTADDL